MDIFKISNEFTVGSKVIIKKEDNRIHLYYQGKIVIPKSDDQTTIELIKKLYKNGLFIQLSKKDLKYFLRRTDTEFLVYDFLVSKVGEIVDSRSKNSIYISHELINILWIFSKFANYHYLRMQLSQYKEKLNQILEHPQKSMDLILTAILIEYIYLQRNNERFNKILSIFKRFDSMIEELPELLILDCSDHLEINPVVVELLDRLGTRGKELLISTLRWVIQNFDYSDFCTREGYSNFIFPILKYLSTEEIINYLDSFRYDCLRELIFDFNYVFTHDLIIRLFKGMNYPDKQIRKKSKSIIEKLRGSLLAGLVYTRFDRDHLNKNKIKAFSFILRISIELLQNFVFKLGLNEDAIYKLFHGDDYYPDFNPKLEATEVIMEKSYKILSKKIDSTIEDNEIKSIFKETEKDTSKETLYQIIKYLLKDDKDIKSIKNKEELKLRILRKLKLGNKL